MTHLSEYQIRRFRLIFNQHADYDLSAVALDLGINSRSALLSPTESSILDPQQNVHIEKKTPSASSKVSHLSLGPTIENINLRLTLNALLAVMQRIGPPVSTEVAKSIILKYDTHCHGYLDFEDFMLFLEDYGELLSAKRSSARQIFAQRASDPAQTIRSSVFHSSSHIHILRALNEAHSEYEFLTALKLHDPEMLWNADDSLTSGIRDSGYVLDYMFLNRSISLRIVSAENVHSFSRVKFRRGEGFVFSTLDPFIKIKFCKQEKQTTTLLGDQYPHWDQEINFDFTIFPGDAMDVLQWVLSQHFQISLYDYNSDGTLAHGELLARGILPVAPVLFTVQRPLELSVCMQSIDGFNRNVILHIRATDKTPEKYAFPKLLDACTRIESYWISKFSEKMKMDLMKEEFVMPIPPRQSPYLDKILSPTPYDNLATEDFWDYYESTIKSLSVLFPRRDFAVLGIDDLNVFRVLPSFLFPLPSPEGVTCEDIPMYVSEIPFFASPNSYSEDSLRILNKLPGPILEKFRPSRPTLSNAHAIISCIAESHFSQISTPASLITKGYGSMTEHAILLCSFFLGFGLESYVAFGKLHEMFHVWVITFGKVGQVSSKFSALVLTKSLDSPDNSSKNLAGLVSIPEEFDHKLRLQEISAKNTNLQGKLWDLTTGSSILLGQDSALTSIRVHTLFNDKNLWMNVQRFDSISRPLFSWDLTNPEVWFPFFTDNNKVAFQNMLQCFYPFPYSVFNSAVNLDLDDSTILNELVRLIEKYRLTNLCISTTFHKGFSKWLMSMIPKFEEARRNKIPYPTLDPVPELPTSCNFQYRVFLLRGHPSVHSIFHHIVESGMIECSVPGAATTLAVKTYTYSIGICTAWVGIGYLAKLK